MAAAVGPTDYYISLWDPFIHVTCGVLHFPPCWNLLHCFTPSRGPSHCRTLWSGGSTHFIALCIVSVYIHTCLLPYLCFLPHSIPLHYAPYYAIYMHSYTDMTIWLRSLFSKLISSHLFQVWLGICIHIMKSLTLLMKFPTALKKRGWGRKESVYYKNLLEPCLCVVLGKGKVSGIFPLLFSVLCWWEW